MKNDVMRIERSSWGTSRRVLAMFCAIVMFFTMNTFTFGALAEAPVAVCGFEEHLHGNECYDGEGQLICALPEHLHTADCFQSSAGEGTVLDQFLALDAQVTLVSPLNVLDDEDVVSEPVENISEEVAEELKDPKNDAEGQTPGADVTEVPDAVADDTVTDNTAADDTAADDTAEDGAPEGLDIQYEDGEASFALNGNTAFAGDVLAAAGLSLEGVTAIGEVVNGVIVEGDLAPDFTVAPVEDVPGEYLITVKQDFESAELGVVIDDVLSTVTLLNGVALKEDAEGSEEEEAGDETLTGDEDAEEASEEETDINEETEDGEGEEKPAALLTTLDFTNYVATAEGHSVFFYDASQVAVFASIEQLMDADGVTVTTEEIAEAPEADGKVTVDNGTLTIYGDGVAVAEDQAYVVTGITMPTSAVIGDGIIVYTADGEATLLNVEPVVETSTENYNDLFSLFQQAEEDPSLLARIADLFTAHAEETRTLQMELLNIGLQDLDDGSEVEPGRVRVRVSLPNALEGVDFKLYHIVDGRPVFIPDAHIFTDANGNAVGLDFYVDSLSPFAITYYTVDFHYDGEEVSIEGESQVLLSSLIYQLNITDENGALIDVANVASVSFTDDRLVTVEEVSGEVEVNGQMVDVGEKDFLLTSKEPFTSKEQLILTLIDEGEVVVDVTDAMDTTSPWDLANTDNTNWLHVKANSSVTQTEQARNASFDLTVSYELKQAVVEALAAYDGTPELVYDLTSVIANSPIDIENFTNGQIKFGNRKIGTYSIVNGIATLRFTDPSYFEGMTSFSGFFSITATTDEEELGTDDEYTYTFPGTSDTVPIKYKKSVEEGSKSVNAEKDADGNWTLHYTANINVNTNLDSLTFNDTIGGLQTLDTGSVKIGGQSVNVSSTGTGFTFDVATALGTTGVAKGSYQVTYDTKLTDAQLKAMTTEKTTETNEVTWKVNGNKDVPGGKTEKEFEKPKEPIPVTKTISATSSQPGDVVNYTVTFGKNTTELSGFHISDQMTDVVIPQGQVTLTYNGETKTIDFGAQSKDTSYSKNMVSLFDYTFPEGTAGNGPVTATYSVKLIDADTAKQNGVYDTTDVSNTAMEHRQNTNDTKKTTVTYEKEPHYEVDKQASYAADADGKVAPGTVINYTLTIGDSSTNMAGVNIKDSMNDLQVLQGDIMIKVGTGSVQKLSDYISSDAIKYSDDGKYSSNYVDLFNFNMPSDAGNGPVVITYTTKVISQDQAAAANIYGNLDIKNTATGGNQHKGTDIPAVFDDYPIAKTVTKGGEDINGTTRGMEDIVHYTLTLGTASMDLGNAVIEDYMTDLQKLVSGITIKKSDGTTITMPSATSPDADDGNRWNWVGDDKFSTADICLFKYKLPADIGYGPITIEYDCQIISETEANENGINGTQAVKNTFKHNGHTAGTQINIEFPKEVTHNPQVRKEFDHWDVANQKVFWNIIVEKDAESAYPLTNVKVQEAWPWQAVSVTEPNQGWNGYNVFNGTYFDIENSTVTTDDGYVLTPGVDYTIDSANTIYLFPVLNQRVTINLAFKSTKKIIDGYYMKNVVYVNDDSGHPAVADQTYKAPKVEAVKNGKYNEDSRVLEWEVMINPTASVFEISELNKYLLLFEDYIPKGLTITNFNDISNTTNPTVSVKFGWRNYTAPVQTEAQSDGKTKVSGNIHPKFVEWSGQEYNSDVSLSGNKVVVTYKTVLSPEEWNEITSSTTGSETFENKVTITAGDGEPFGDSDRVTVTTEGYINKYDSTVENGGFVVDAEDLTSHSKNIMYTVEINPNGYVLNHGLALELSDYIDTNMDLDTESVKLVHATKNSSGKLVANDPEVTPADIDISYNDDARLLSIRNIPDSMPLLLTYTCYARAQGQDSFKNTATLIGGGSHSDSTNETHKVQTNDAGVKLDGISFNLKKVDENDIKVNLPGAKFQLYECKLAIGDLTSSEPYNQAYWDALLAKMNRITAGNGTAEEIEEIRQNFKIIEYIPVQGEKTTGVTGYVDWKSLNEHKLYAWVETSAPENYTGNTDYHYFVGYQHIDLSSDNDPQDLLSDAEQTNRKHAAWALDDACQLANDIRVASIANLVTWTATNMESKYTSITGTKVWENDSNNLFKTRPVGGVELQLVRISADGTRENIGRPVIINADKNGNWPTYLWNKLAAKDADGNDYKYTVVETKVPNYTTRYSDNGEGQTSGTITVTNRMIPKSTDIRVEKQFDEGDNDKPNEINVELYVIETDEDGVASAPQRTYQRATLNAINNWKYTFEKLDTTRVETLEDGTQKVYTLTYTVVEDTTGLEGKYTVVYSDDGKGVLETTEENPLVIYNKKIKYGNLEVTKELIGVPAVNESTEFKVTIKNSKGEYLQADKKTFGATEYEFTVSQSTPLEVEHLLVDTYTVTEKTGTGYTDIIDGYAWDEDGSVTTREAELVENETKTVALRNEYEAQLGSLKITKNVKVNGEAVTEDNKSLVDGTYTFTIVDKEGKVAKCTGLDENGQVSITISNGQSSTVEITDLAPGEYTITESTPENDALPVVNPITVTVEAGKSGDQAENLSSPTTRPRPCPR